MDIDEILDRFYPLPEESKAALKEYMVLSDFSKSHMLFKAGKIESKVYFIKKGIVRAYANAGDNEITFWFGKEGDTVVSMKNYVANQKGYENIECLEDCELYEFKTSHLQQLFLKDIHLANWGRKFAEIELIIAEEKFISRQFRTALERYKALLNESPDLVRRVQLGHIASFLGITQVSLSRIRAEIK